MSDLASPVVWVWLAWGARTLVAASVCAAIFTACRYAVRVDRVAGKLLSIGVCVRLFAYAGLFFISYFNLPFLRELHTGDGFWRVSPDARLYYDLALRILQDGLTVSLEAAPSPGFVRVLSGWMWVVGRGPAAAALLNACCYVCVCLLVMKTLRGDQRSMRLLVGAFTLSPALIVFGSQPLKDVLFLSLVVAVCVAARFVIAHAAGRGGRTALWLDGAMIATGVFLLAGIRPYYAIFLLAALAAALPFAALASRQRLVRMLTAAGILGAGAVAVLAGMGPQGRETIQRLSGSRLPTTRAEDSVQRSEGGMRVPARAEAGRRGTTLTRPLAATATTLSVQHNDLFPGNVLSMEAQGQSERLYVGWVNIIAASARYNQLAFDFGQSACGGIYFNDGKAFYIPDGPHRGWWVQAPGGCTYVAPHTVITVKGDISSDAASGYVLYFADTSTTPASYQYVNISRDYEGSGASHAWDAGEAVVNTGTPVQPLPALILSALDRARLGFMRTEGRTGFGGTLPPKGLRGRITATLRGAAAIWIPVFVLRPLGVLDIGPPTGYLTIAELDTVFNAVVLLALGIVLWGGRTRCRRHTEYLSFLAVIVGVTGLGLAYVVTNFGTLFRMRLMVMLPLWMTLFAMGETARFRPSTPAPLTAAAPSRGAASEPQ